jgi:hypothetical protein
MRALFNDSKEVAALVGCVGSGVTGRRGIPGYHPSARPQSTTTPNEPNRPHPYLLLVDRALGCRAIHSLSRRSTVRASAAALAWAWRRASRALKGCVGWVGTGGGGGGEAGKYWCQCASGATAHDS